MAFAGLVSPVLMKRPRVTSTPSSWTPASLTNLASWYDANQQTEANTADVTTFTDRSGNGHHFSQATLLARPTMQTSGIGGKKALKFDGSLGQTMSCATGLMNGATAGYFFSVIQWDNDPPTTGGGGPLLDGFTTDTQQSHMPFTDGNIYSAFGTSSRQPCGNPTPSLTSPAMMAMISGSGDYRCLINNATLFSTGTNTVGFNTTTRLMGSSPFGGATISGLVAEVIIGNAVPSSTDISNIRSYFNTKYGTSF
jgi:hypothetical protein